MASPPVLPGQYLVYTGYVGTDDPGTTQTWVLPPAFAYGAATPATPLYLPFLWTGNGDVTKLQVTKNDDFTLGTQYSGKPTPTNVSITLQLTGKNAWSTKPAARAAFRANYLSFVETIETQFELAATPLLIGGATSMIGAALVQYAPLPLAEVLTYACGLATGLGTGAAAGVDLLPGMRLRTEPSTRQYLAPPSGALSGYLSGGTLRWDVTTSTASGSPVMAFDAFLGAIAAPQVSPPPSTPGPVYGLLDLQQTGVAYRHQRLIYPQNVIDASAPGNTSAAMNVQIAGANTLAALRTNPAYSTIFFGRDVVVPEIAIWLALADAQSQAVFVPVGTTVMNLLERFTRWKPLPSSQQTVTLTRYVLSTQQRGSLTGATFAFAPPNAQSNDLRAFDTPLLAGDALRIRLA